ncbi:hypothetical protein EGX64_03730 [Staphylococcus epidermidis]|nr:hypothetical protein EGX64_03730 [Staphylococcus epidermidis]KAB2226633.1 hypothetical protein F9B46_06665 [Staphylococcus epidermidis]PIH12327.1 hypothetical protein CTJ10_08920 [Staphylococcus epidermidis]
MCQKIIKHIYFHLTLQLEESNITLNRNIYDLRMI